MASLSQMRSMVYEQERLNSELRNQLYELEVGINRAGNSWDQLSNRITGTLVTGEKRMNSSHERALAAYEIQCDIERIYRLFKNVELANKKIRECNNKIYYDFANYNAVRKIVEAMLGNLEVSFVSDKTITKAVEIKHLQMPDYWLTCALLSIMAWRRDDRVLAERALERACMLDKKNTSMFFFAFHMRIERDSVALQWFRNYITCEKTGEDSANILFMFSIITKMTGIETDDGTYSEIENYVNSLIEERLSSEGYSEEDMVKRIMGYYNAMCSFDSINYPALTRFCRDNKTLIELMGCAKNNIKILEFIRKTLNITSDEKKDRLNKFIDEIIRRANTAEIDVRNEIRYNETVIKLKGDVETAKADHEYWLEHNRTDLDIISEMVDWVYNAGETEVKDAERERMFIIISGISRKAVDAVVNNYRARFKTVYPIKINEYESQADLTDSATESRKIDSYFSEKARKLIEMESIKSAYIFFGAAILGIIGGIALSPTLFAATPIGIVGGIVKIVLTNRAKKFIAKNCEIDAENTKSTFKLMQDDFVKYTKDYRSYDAYYNEICAEFDKI